MQALRDLLPIQWFSNLDGDSWRRSGQHASIFGDNPHRNDGYFLGERLGLRFRLCLSITPRRSKEQREDGNPPEPFAPSQFHAHYRSDEA